VVDPLAANEYELELLLLLLLAAPENDRPSSTTTSRLARSFERFSMILALRLSVLMVDAGCIRRACSSPNDAAAM